MPSAGSRPMSCKHCWLRMGALGIHRLHLLITGFPHSTGSTQPISYHWLVSMAFPSRLAMQWGQTHPYFQGSYRSTTQHIRCLWGICSWLCYHQSFVLKCAHQTAGPTEPSPWAHLCLTLRFRFASCANDAEMWLEQLATAQTPDYLIGSCLHSLFLGCSVPCCNSCGLSNLSHICCGVRLCELSAAPHWAGLFVRSGGHACHCLMTPCL